MFKFDGETGVLCYCDAGSYQKSNQVGECLRGLISLMERRRSHVKDCHTLEFILDKPFYYELYLT